MKKIAKILAICASIGVGVAAATLPASAGVIAPSKPVAVETIGFETVAYHSRWRSDQFHARWRSDLERHNRWVSEANRHNRLRSDRDFHSRWRSDRERHERWRSDRF